MNLFHWAAGAMTVIELGTPCAPNRPAASSIAPERLQVDSLYQSWLSGLRSPTQAVVVDSAEWASWWLRIAGNYVRPNPPRPAVNFSSHIVVVIGTGSHSVSGFSVRIDSAVVQDSTVTVYWADVGPGRGCPAGTGPSRPAKVVRLPKRSEPVRFDGRVLRTKCG